MKAKQLDRGYVREASSNARALLELIAVIEARSIWGSADKTNLLKAVAAFFGITLTEVKP